jgi:septal ring factor EnvC (AmiA/AmiB activator)
MRRLAVVSSSLFALLFPCGAQAWAWPIDGPVLRPFVFGSDPYAGGQHRGIDVGGAVGETVRAPVAGTVSFAGSVPAGGRALTIRTGDGYSVTLLQLGSIAVQRGAELGEGVLVGAVGESSDAATREPHVHLGVRRTVEEEGYLDPLAFLPERTRVVPAPAPPAASPSPV